MGRPLRPQPQASFHLPRVPGEAHGECARPLGVGTPACRSTFRLRRYAYHGLAKLGAERFGSHRTALQPAGLGGLHHQEGFHSGLVGSLGAHSPAERRGGKLLVEPAAPLSPISGARLGRSASGLWEVRHPRRGLTSPNPGVYPKSKRLPIGRRDAAGRASAREQVTYMAAFPPSGDAHTLLAPTFEAKSR